MMNSIFAIQSRKFFATLRPGLSSISPGLSTFSLGLSSISHGLSTFSLGLVSFSLGLISMSPGVRAQDVEVAIKLQSGGMIHGTWINHKDFTAAKRPDQFLIEVAPGMRVILNAQQVINFEDNRSPEVRKYIELAKTLEDTPAKQNEMVNWADQNHLGLIAEAHRERIVELEPTNESMWQRLGYDLDYNKNWVRKEILAWRNGLKLVGQRGRSPQHVAILQREEEEAERIRKARNEVKALFKDIDSNSRRKAQSLEALERLDNPLAVAPLAEMLASSGDVQRRLFLLNLIGKFETPEALTALAETAINDSDSKVRAEAIKRLKPNHTNWLSATCINYLRRNKRNVATNMSHELIDHIGDLLADFPDEKAVLPLIENLITVHETTTGNSNSFNVGSGPGGMSLGSQRKVQRTNVNQSSILKALQTTTKNSSLSYDADAWLRWYAEQHASTGLNLRRDP